MLRKGLGFVAIAVLLSTLVIWHMAATRNVILSTLALGQPFAGPSSIVVDDQAGRAFIAGGSLASQPSTFGGSQGDRVFVVDIGTGTLMQIIHFAGAGEPILSLDRPLRRVFLADANSSKPGQGIVRALDSATGTSRGSVLIGTRPAGLAVDSRRGHVIVVGGGSSWCSSASCDLDRNVARVLDARTMHTLKIVPLVSSPYRVVVDEQSGRAFVTTVTTLEVLDIANGRVLHTMSGAFGILAVDDLTNRVFLSDPWGHVRMIDATSGRMVGTVPIRGTHLNAWSGTATAAVDAQSGNVLIIKNGAKGITGAVVQRGAVSIVDGRTGHLRRTIAVGAWPVAIAVDSRLRLAFVANADDNTLSVLDLQQERVVRTLPIGLAPAALVADSAVGRVLVASLDTGGQADRPDMWAWLPAAVRDKIPFIPQRPSMPSTETRATGSVRVVDPFG